MAAPLPGPQDKALANAAELFAAADRDGDQKLSRAEVCAMLKKASACCWAWAGGADAWVGTSGFMAASRQARCLEPTTACRSREVLTPDGREEEDLVSAPAPHSAAPRAPHAPAAPQVKKAYPQMGELAAMLEEGALEKAAKGVWGASTKPGRYSKCARRPAAGPRPARRAGCS